MEKPSLNKLANCSICKASLESPSLLLNCQHIFCRACIVHWHKHSARLHTATCPECRAPFSLKHLINVVVKECLGSRRVLLCPNGCREMVTPRSIIKHIRNCHLHKHEMPTQTLLLHNSTFFNGVSCRPMRMKMESQCQYCGLVLPNATSLLQQDHEATCATAYCNVQLENVSSTSRTIKYITMPFTLL